MQKPTINCNTNFGTLKDLTMNTSSTAGDLTQPSHEYEVNIHVVEEIVGESNTDEQSPNQPSGPPFEVLTTTVSNILDWLVAETLTKSVTLSYVGLDNLYSKFGGY